MVNSSWTLPWNYNCHSNSCGLALQYWSLLLAYVRISEQFKVRLNVEGECLFTISIYIVLLHNLSIKWLSSKGRSPMKY